MKTALPQLAVELNTTDRTLRRALQQGLMRAERPSPRTVDVPLAERMYLRRAWPLLETLRESLRTEPTVSLAVLFGSRARGDNAPQSDVDLIVNLREGANERALASRVAEKIGLRVQLVALEEAVEAPLFLSEALREGRVLVDRDRMWPVLLQRRQAIERAAARERRRIDKEFSLVFAE